MLQFYMRFKRQGMHYNAEWYKITDCMSHRGVLGDPRRHTLLIVVRDRDPVIHLDGR